MARSGPNEEARQELCEWLRANGIDPNTVPIDSSLSITGTGEQLSILYTEFVRDPETGNILAGEDGFARRRAASVPCVVEPPFWLHIPGSQS